MSEGNGDILREDITFISRELLLAWSVLVSSADIVVRCFCFCRKGERKYAQQKCSYQMMQWQHEVSSYRGTQGREKTN